jgi:hypothetical protein
VNNQNFTGGLTVDNDGSTVLTVDRATSDGTIIDVQKAGSSVGSIGATGGYLTVTASGGSDAGAKLGNSAIFPCNTNGSDRDAGINLGLSTVRWKDLYLSGGVYLGGTGSANKLDDYEEGTWTPAVSATSSAPSSISYSERTGIYTKIGNLVTLQCELLISSKSGGSGGATITGMPFACKSVDIVPVGSMEASFINLSTGYSMFAVMTYQSQSAIFLRQYGDSVAESSISIGSVGSSSRIRFTLTYQTQ